MEMEVDTLTAASVLVEAPDDECTASNVDGCDVDPFEDEELEECGDVLVVSAGRMAGVFKDSCGVDMELAASVLQTMISIDIRMLLESRDGFAGSPNLSYRHTHTHV